MEKLAQMNELFRSRIEEGGESLKLAEEAGAAYIKAKLREESFLRKIIPPQNITKQDVSRNETGDGVYKLVDLEPDSSALALNFRAEGEYHYVFGERFRIDFFKVASQIHEKAEMELLAYESPIMKILQENAVFDIQAVEDRVFYNHAAAAISGSERDAVSHEVTISRPAIAAARKLILAKKLEPYSLLMTEEMFSDVMTWNYQYAGDSMMDEMNIKGLEKATLLGMPLIVTNKAEFVSSREFWLFTKPEFLGRFYVLEDTKFWLDKRRDMVEWQTWESVGVGIGNTNGICRVTFDG